MYGVSAEYITQFHKPGQSWHIRGTVGNVAFDDDNILTGSFNISNGCSNKDDIKLGSSEIGQLSATFIGLNIGRHSWKNKEIEFEIGLEVGEDEIEWVPGYGPYKIASAEWSLAGVSVTAFDNMRKFDKPWGYTNLAANNMLGFLEFVCEEVGVECGMDSLSGFCNGSEMTDFKQTDCETYRDVLYYIAQTVGAFATMNRDGEVILRRFVSNAVDDISAQSRFSSSTFSDYQTHYTGISLVLAEKEETYYSGAELDNGETINLGQNPFMQGVNYKRLVENLVAEVQNIQFTPFSSVLLGGLHFDLGDSLVQSGGLGANSTCLITSYDYTYNASYSMVGTGADPTVASASSKADKNIAALMNNTKRNETASYEQKNTKVIDIADNERKNIVSMRIASNTNTKAMIHIEVNLESLANTPTAKYALDSNKVVLSDIWDGIKNTAVKGEITYIVNSVEDELHPIESWIDGNHVLHLMYILGLTQGIVAYFDAYMKAIGGSIHIDRGGVWTYALGVGLVGDGKWDGTIEIEEVAEEFSLIEIILDGNGEVISIDTQVPSGVPVSDVADDFSIPEVTVETIGEVVTFTFHQYSVPLLVESGEYLISEGGDVFYTEGD